MISCNKICDFPNKDILHTNILWNLATTYEYSKKHTFQIVIIIKRYNQGVQYVDNFKFCYLKIYQLWSKTTYLTLIPLYSSGMLFIFFNLTPSFMAETFYSVLVRWCIAEHNLNEEFFEVDTSNFNPYILSFIIGWVLKFPMHHVWPEQYSLACNSMNLQIFKSSILKVSSFLTCNIKVNYCKVCSLY